MKQTHGIILPQVVVAIFIFALLALAFVSVSVAAVRASVQSERRVVGLGIAIEQIEAIRLLNYFFVGFRDGSFTDPNNPIGILDHEKIIERNNQTYTVKLDIRYVNDPLTVTENRDYKVVRVAVEWRDAIVPGAVQDIVLVTYVTESQLGQWSSSSPSPSPSPSESASPSSIPSLIPSPSSALSPSQLL